MKNLIFINGTMGVGKTATSRQLQKLLPNCVFLDGDWCWDADPFIVTEETKDMVQRNISYLLNSFLRCTAYENIVFCWVMHMERIIGDLLTLLTTQDYNLYKFSLVCSESALKSRLQKDIDSGIRDAGILERSLPRLKNYLNMDTVRIDVSEITAEQAASVIYEQIIGRIGSDAK
jgi:tRNA A37 N6-isopentenylltransferase MiaA